MSRVTAGLLSAIGGAAIGMTLERAGGVENLFNALDKDGLPREGLAYASLVGERVATGFVSLVKSFRLMRDQMIQASTKEEAAQIMANQVLRAGKGNPAPAPKPDTGGGTTVRTSTVLLVAGAAGTLYGGYKYTVYRVGQDKVDRCIALAKSKAVGSIVAAKRAVDTRAVAVVATMTKVVAKAKPFADAALAKATPVVQPVWAGCSQGLLAAWRPLAPRVTASRQALQPRVTAARQALQPHMVGLHATYFAAIDTVAVALARLRCSALGAAAAVAVSARTAAGTALVRAGERLATGSAASEDPSFARVIALLNCYDNKTKPAMELLYPGLVKSAEKLVARVQTAAATTTTTKPQYAQSGYPGSKVYTANAHSTD